MVYIILVLILVLIAIYINIVTKLKKIKKEGIENARRRRIHRSSRR